MKYYQSVCELGLLLPEPKQFQEQFGGLPWGLPHEKWPLCNNCGKPMTIIAQLQHHPVRFNLGKEDRVLFIFQCLNDPGFCDFGEPGKGNAALILDAEEMTKGRTKPSQEIPIEPELRIIHWIEKEELLKKSDESRLIKGDYEGLSYEEIDLIEIGTKVGGYPYWFQSGLGFQEPYQFLMQMLDMRMAAI
ncbi:hypothetical protein [Thermoflavimicrobium dichotomicum]|uniref:DUF1963 domain-containing protein n=1 Tax=Thermoflavimicrobium dichotomicum TaxID=46223 RepID=A0A1I3RT21_9BACL|nr:hypothetical protein [Thermoflavimicrobium dichotomicum]SFJ49693.1 hypothetical protein SAMN05421852_11124 [Thermoflavimicrobium dichotomicum]